MAARVVVIDDHVPTRVLGAGYPRSLAVLEALAREASGVTLCASQEPLPDAGAVEKLPSGVNVFPARGADAVRAAIAGAPGVLWISRPNNLELVERIARREPQLLAGWHVVYDAEAVFALRVVAARAILGEAVSAFQQRRMLRQELRPAEIADVIVAVTPSEAQAIAATVSVPVRVISVPGELRLTSREWQDRRHLLFIGPVSDRMSPNGDALAHFVARAMPAIGATGVRLRVAGRGATAASWLGDLASPYVDLLGPVDDIEPLYDAALALVVPLRYGAGMPTKIVHAAQRGLPAIVSSLAARQMGWQAGRELLIADDPSTQLAAVRELSTNREQWQALRDGALAALTRDHAPERFAAGVREVAFDMARR